MKARKTFVVLTISIAFPFAFNSFAADILVSTPVTATSINKAIASANPGDHVMIPDGTYSSVDQINIPHDVDGTKNSPIILKPVTPGGVIFTGTQTFGKRIMLIKGDWWVIQGFQFVDIFVGGRVRGHNTRGIEIKTPSVGVRITDNYFESFAAAMLYESNNWAILLGATSNGDVFDVRIDHNTFVDTFGQVVYPAESAYRTHIDHNWFYGSSGTSKLTMVSQPGGPGTTVLGARENFTVFEYNIIENFEGPAAAVNNKGSRNTYRYNVFKSTNGKKTNGLALRGGSNCIVEGNYFFSVSHSNLRIHGSGHQILNNYFEHTINDGGATITIGANGNANYADVHDLNIFHNTIVNPEMYVLHLGGWAGTIKPTNVIFKNNLIWAKKYNAYIVRNQVGVEGTWVGNVHYKGVGADSRYWLDQGGGPPPATGITKADAKLIQGSHIYRLQASSTNAINQGVSVTNVTTDIDGHVRDDSPDIGCDEYSITDVIRPPVTNDDVGYDWSPPVRG